MWTYIARRVFQAILIMAGLTVLFFVLLNLQPGGACINILAQQSPNQQQKYDACVRAYGYDKPLPVQYLSWLGNAVHGNFGDDKTSGAPIGDAIKAAFPATLILVGISYLFQQLLALPLGILGALKRYSIYDQVLTLFSYVGLAMPSFWLALILVLTFAVALPHTVIGIPFTNIYFNPHFQGLPPGGILSPQINIPNGYGFGTTQYWQYFAQNPGLMFGDLMSHLILPGLTLAIIGIAGDSRFMRASMLDVLGQDYVRTARAKGLPERKVILKHALRNALLPIVTNIGLFIPTLVSGAIITETVFAWPGLGLYFNKALGAHDGVTLQTLLLLTALFTLIANLLTDLAYAAVDPRIRYS